MNGYGSILLNNNAGTSGRVLLSNGPTSSSTWGSPTRGSYDATDMVTSTSNIVVAAGGSWTTIPGLSANFSTTSNAKVLVNFNIGTSTPACGSCGVSYFALDILMDINDGTSYHHTEENDRRRNISGSYLFEVGPGNHTLSLRTQVISGPSVQFATGIAGSSNIIYQVMSAN